MEAKKLSLMMDKRGSLPTNLDVYKQQSPFFDSRRLSKSPEKINKPMENKMLIRSQSSTIFKPSASQYIKNGIDDPVELWGEYTNPKMRHPPAESFQGQIFAEQPTEKIYHFKNAKSQPKKSKNYGYPYLSPDKHVILALNAGCRRANFTSENFY
jgi:hypothetical protein